MQNLLLREIKGKYNCECFSFEIDKCVSQKKDNSVQEKTKLYLISIM